MPFSRCADLALHRQATHPMLSPHSIIHPMGSVTCYISTVKFGSEQALLDLDAQKDSSSICSLRRQSAAGALVLCDTSEIFHQAATPGHCSMSAKVTIWKQTSKLLHCSSATNKVAATDAQHSASPLMAFKKPLQELLSCFLLN